MKINRIKLLYLLVLLLCFHHSYSQKEVEATGKSLSLRMTSRFNYFQHTPLNLDVGGGVAYKIALNARMGLILGLGYDNITGSRRDSQIELPENSGIDLTYLNRKISLSSVTQSVQFSYSLPTFDGAASGLDLLVGASHAYVIRATEYHDRLYRFDDTPSVFVSDQRMDVSEYYKQNMISLQGGVSFTLPSANNNINLSIIYETSISQMSLVGFAIPQHAGSIYPKSLTLSLFYIIKQFR